MTRLKTHWLRRRWIEYHLDRFLSSMSDLNNRRSLEIGSGKKWRYISHSITLNRDISAEPDQIGDAESLPFGNNEFDLILCLEVIEHTANPDKIINEIHRTLKSSGQVFLTTPFCLEIHDPENDYHRFPRQGLELLFRNFSQVEIINHGGIHGVLAHLFGQTSLGRLFYPALSQYGWCLDRLFPQKSPRACLGYSVIAKK